MNHFGRLAAVAAVVGSISGAAWGAPASSHVADVAMRQGAWSFRAIWQGDLNGNPRVEAFVGFADGAAVIADNIIGVMYLRNEGATSDPMDDTWDAKSWGTLEKCEVVKSVTTRFGITDEADINLLGVTAGSLMTIANPEVPQDYVAGLLAGDPLAAFVSSSQDRDAIVEILTSAGYKAADIQLESVQDSLGCGPRAVLTALAVTVEGIVSNPLPSVATDAEAEAVTEAMGMRLLQSYVGTLRAVCADPNPKGNATVTIAVASSRGSGEAMFEVKCGEGEDPLLNISDPHVRPESIGLSKDDRVVVSGAIAADRITMQVFGYVPPERRLQVEGAISPARLQVQGTDSAGSSFSVSAWVSSNQVVVGSNALSWWTGILTASAGAVPCTGICIVQGSDIQVLPIAEFADATTRAELASMFMDGCPTCQALLCYGADATAISEYRDLKRDSKTCYQGYLDQHDEFGWGCAIGSIITCGACLWPVTTVITCPLCVTSVLCVTGDAAHSTLQLHRTDLEYHRTFGCICDHAADRSMGLNPPRCTFSCP